MYLRRTLQAIIDIKPSELGADTYNIILNKLRRKFEGHCITEGYVKNDSIKLITFSLGKADDPYSGNVRFQTTYSAEILNPIEGMQLECTITLTTKMGIRAKLSNDPQNPLDILVPRDHYVDNPYYHSLSEGDTCKLEVVANKYKWGSKDIFVLAKIIQPETKIESKSENTNDDILESNIEPEQFNIDMSDKADMKTVNLEEQTQQTQQEPETKSVAFTPEKKIIKKKK